MDDHERSDEWMEDLLRSLVLWLSAHGGRRRSQEEVLRQARQVVEAMQAEGLRPVRWDAAERVSIRALRSPSMLYRGVRLAVHLTEMATPALMTVPVGDGTVTETLTMSVQLRDEAGDSIQALDFTGEALVRRVEEYAWGGRRVEVLGRVLAVPVGLDGARRAFVVEVSDVRQTTSALDLLGATNTERAEADAMLRDVLDARRSLIDYMVSELERELGVVGLDKFPLLRLCLRFTVLQALSMGRINQAAGNLHMLDVGPPGQGKKLPILAARVLNPRAAEASASRLSPAGLVGASYVTADGYKSQPGLIPQADGGVVLLQDAHALTKSEVNKLAPVFQELIEDGVVRDAKAGGVRREVSVGLIIDANRSGQLQSRSVGGAEAPILTCRPLLSRIDFIVEIPADAKRAWAVGASMYGNQRVRSEALDNQPWVRRLRVLVATLRDRNSEVDLTPVGDAMRHVHEEIADENRERIAEMPEAGDVPARFAISFVRFVAAAARAEGRAVATQADVDEAVPFLRLKLATYSLIVPDTVTVTDDQRARRQAYYDRHRGEIVRTEDLARDYTKETGEAVSERTVRRDLKELGAKRTNKGRYRLPPPDPSPEP